MTDRTVPSVDMKSFEGKPILQGKYLLEEYKGGGNFGAIFRSWQKILGVKARRVAVKISKDTGFDIENARETFADVFMLAEAMDEMTDVEARSHLVHIYDAGILPEEGNRMYVVMEYVQGTNLDHEFRSYRQVPADLLLKWMRQICCTLKGLHTLVPPLIHRDLKPDNILLGSDKNIRVVDFGLAARLIYEGYVPGSIGPIKYMAPETLKGESVPASDVYTLGLLMYEGLTGQLPLGHLIPPRDLPQALYCDWLCKQMSAIVPSKPSTLNNTVKPQLDELVLRCLKFNPSERFHNAGELLKALNSIYDGSPPPDDERALNEGRKLRSSGDLSGARSSFEKGLDAASSSKEIRFALMHELGQVLIELKEYREAAKWLEEAWKLARNGAVLRKLQERIDLLNEITDAYLLSGNKYKEKCFRDLASRELQKRRG
jgi:eukaryotic-like serine/threonine-protein kinase